ncbi:hypothetical protein WJX72_001225 [[Myrmecia] bisecta]|uniref:BZIP domain-containing protein n=1 Tax=[Myrmecia] bisecta TaxID=41462 RepID=A0AAW1Q6G8_9CHLO
MDQAASYAERQKHFQQRLASLQARQKSLQEVPAQLGKRGSAGAHVIAKAYAGATAVRRSLDSGPSPERRRPRLWEQPYQQPPAQPASLRSSSSKPVGEASGMQVISPPSHQPLQSATSLKGRLSISIPSESISPRENMDKATSSRPNSEPSSAATSEVHAASAPKHEATPGARSQGGRAERSRLRTAGRLHMGLESAANDSAEDSDAQLSRSAISAGVSITETSPTSSSRISDPLSDNRTRLPPSQARRHSDLGCGNSSHHLNTFSSLPSPRSQQAAAAGPPVERSPRAKPQLTTIPSQREEEGRTTEEIQLELQQSERGASRGAESRPPAKKPQATHPPGKPPSFFARLFGCFLPNSHQLAQDGIQTGKKGHGDMRSKGSSPYTLDAEQPDWQLGTRAEVQVGYAFVDSQPAGEELGPQGRLKSAISLPTPDLVAALKSGEPRAAQRMLSDADDLEAPAKRRLRTKIAKLSMTLAPPSSTSIDAELLQPLSSGAASGDECTSQRLPPTQGAEKGAPGPDLGDLTPEGVKTTTISISQLLSLASSTLSESPCPSEGKKKVKRRRNRAKSPAKSEGAAPQAAFGTDAWFTSTAPRTKSLDAWMVQQYPELAMLTNLAKSPDKSPRRKSPCRARGQRSSPSASPHAVPHASSTRVSRGSSPARGARSMGKPPRSPRHLASGASSAASALSRSGSHVDAPASAPLSRTSSAPTATLITPLSRTSSAAKAAAPSRSSTSVAEQAASPGQASPSHLTRNGESDGEASNDSSDALEAAVLEQARKDASHGAAQPAAGSCRASGSGAGQNNIDGDQVSATRGRADDSDSEHDVESSRASSDALEAAVLEQAWKDVSHAALQPAAGRASASSGGQSRVNGDQVFAPGAAASSAVPAKVDSLQVSASAGSGIGRFRAQHPAPVAPAMAPSGGSATGKLLSSLMGSLGRTRSKDLPATERQTLGQASVPAPAAAKAGANAKILAPGGRSQLAEEASIGPEPDMSAFRPRAFKDTQNTAYLRLRMCLLQLRDVRTVAAPTVHAAAAWRDHRIACLHRQVPQEPMQYPDCHLLSGQNAPSPSSFVSNSRANCPDSIQPTTIIVKAAAKRSLWKSSNRQISDVDWIPEGQMARPEGLARAISTSSTDTQERDLLTKEHRSRSLKSGNKRKAETRATSEDDEDIELRRARNREAARKSRERKDINATLQRHVEGAAEKLQTARTQGLALQEQLHHVLRRESGLDAKATLHMLLNNINQLVVCLAADAKPAAPVNKPIMKPRQGQAAPSLAPVRAKHVLANASSAKDGPDTPNQSPGLPQLVRGGSLNKYCSLNAPRQPSGLKRNVSASGSFAAAGPARLERSVSASTLHSNLSDASTLLGCMDEVEHLMAVDFQEGHAELLSQLGMDDIEENLNPPTLASQDSNVAETCRASPAAHAAPAQRSGPASRLQKQLSIELIEPLPQAIMASDEASLSQPDMEPTPLHSMTGEGPGDFDSLVSLLNGDRKAAAVHLGLTQALWGTIFNAGGHQCPPSGTPTPQSGYHPTPAHTEPADMPFDEVAGFLCQDLPVALV